eukprot:scaffold106009_cov17-Tisochrysis_lutea.AAC.4
MWSVALSTPTWQCIHAGASMLTYIHGRAVALLNVKNVKRGPQCSHMMAHPGVPVPAMVKGNCLVVKRPERHNGQSGLIVMKLNACIGASV